VVALGQMATSQRLLPFTETLAGALDKIRGALSTSAQRELLGLLDALQFIGVPALPIAPAVRRAIETAWFEDRALRIVYQKNPYTFVTRLIRIRSLVFDRSVTLLNCVDLELGEDRQFRLDKIDRATALPSGELPSA
jgi:predicted DNA-binding transcriptional regulator YafY